VAKKAKQRWSCKKRFEEKDRKRMGNLLGFLIGPYLLSEMHGRPPKIPPGYPTPEAISNMTEPQMLELKRQLQQFLRETGGPDLTPEEREKFATFASSNPTVSLRRP
jgi:hypothetical protein